MITTKVVKMSGKKTPVLGYKNGNKLGVIL
jgi:hypothetical protein